MTDESMGYFATAYTVYTFFYTVSALGLPQALSILISSFGNDENSRIKCESIYKTAVKAMTALGVALSLIMLAFSGSLSKITGSPQSDVCIGAIAPILLFVCLSGVRRGWFQGKQNMVPTAISQLIESLGKPIFGLVLVLYAIGKGYQSHIIPAFAIMGIVISHALSMLVLLFTKRINGTKKNTKKQGIKTKKALVMIAKVAFPITLSSLVMSFTNLLDLSMVMRRLCDIGFSTVDATAQFGNYSGLVVPIYSLPLSLITPLCYTVMPLLSGALREKDGGDKALSIYKGALRSSLIISLPCTVGLAILANPVLSLIFGDVRAGVGALNLTLLSPAIFFGSLSVVMSSLLQAGGKTLLPVISMAAGCLSKIISGYYLIGIIGMAGTPLSTLISCVVTFILNYLFLPPFIRHNLKIRNIFLPLSGAILCGAAAYFTNNALYDRIGNISLIAAIIIAAVVYLVFVTVFPVFDKDTLFIFPGGKYIEKIIIRTRKNKNEQTGIIKKNRI